MRLPQVEQNQLERLQTTLRAHLLTALSTRHHLDLAHTTQSLVNVLHDLFEWVQNAVALRGFVRVVVLQDLHEWVDEFCLVADAGAALEEEGEKLAAEGVVLGEGGENGEGVVGVVDERGAGLDEAEQEEQVVGSVRFGVDLQEEFLDSCAKMWALKMGQK